MEERPGQSSAQPQGAAGKSVEGSEGNLPAQGKSAQEGKLSEGKMTEQQKPNEGASTSESKSGKMSAEGKAGTERKSVKLQSQDVSKVKSYFSEHKPSVRRIEKSRVSVSIGVALPATVVLYDLPPDVIVVHGACPIKYFLWGDDVVLVDSCTRHVVEIIPGVA
jgi:Protein of unknown function (DUF1236)